MKKLLFAFAAMMLSVGASAQTIESYDLYGEDVVTETATGFVDIVLNLKNVNKLTSWQADMVLPEGFELAVDEFDDPMAVISGSRTNTKRHALTAAAQEDGSIRLLCASQSNATFKGTDGEVATITLVYNGDDVTPGCYPVTFKSILLVEPDETSYEPADMEVKIYVSTETGINDLNAAAGNTPVNVYSVSGQLLRSNVNSANATDGLDQGIYLVGNKKVAVK